MEAAHLGLDIVCLDGEMDAARVVNPLHLDVQMPGRIRQLSSPARLCAGMPSG
ncbi:MAG: hypothetical protein ABI650_03170 [Dokdonella sp.]